MTEVPTSSVRRHLLDGGYALLLLSFAIANGYWLLAPPSLRAKPLPVVAVAVPRPPHAMTDATPGPVEPDKARPERETPPRRDGDKPTRRQADWPALPPPAPPVPWPGRVSGFVLDADRKPMTGALVVAGGRELPLNPEGGFFLETPPPGSPVIVKLPGYARAVVPPPGPPSGPLEIVMKPLAVKAAYLTYFGVAHGGIRGKVNDLLNRTELNAVVIDVKGDRGWIPYRTEVPEALAAGAQGPVILRDFDGLIADYKARGVYTIARVVTFKDNVLAQHRPDLAVIDTRTGRPWMDNEKLAWMDPFREEVWQYNIAIAREAASKGFDEIQFDYVRFPTDGRLAAARYSRPVNKETRLPTIVAFLQRVRRELGPVGVYVAADVFGYTAFNENDTDIGQRIEELAPHVDYICPMVYPSGYHVGIPGFRNPVTHPYEVVYESVRLIRKRSTGLPVRVRPWLQDFKDYAFDRRIFGVTEIRAQIKGSDDAGGTGWMLWNPRNDYTGAALRAKGPVASR